MLSLHRALLASALTCVVALVCAHPSSAQDADTAEVQRYVLTEAGLAKYTRATESLAALGRDCEADDEDAATIAALVAALEAMPGARAAVQAAGMTPRDYVVFTLSLVHNSLAAFAAGQPGGTRPAGVSQANVDFVNGHEAELRAVQLAAEQECDGDEDASEAEAEADEQ